VTAVPAPALAGSVPAAALADSFADAMAGRASSLAVVTARDAVGRPRGLLVSSLCSYSLTPPSLLVAIDRGTRSFAALTAATEFGVHLLGREHEPLAAVFASRRTDKFAGLEWAWAGPVPRISGAAAYAHCLVARVVHHGDHAILIGEVAGLDRTEHEPLVQYARRRDWRLR
jgi:flavin reductase ActVB